MIATATPGGYLLVEYDAEDVRKWAERESPKRPLDRAEGIFLFGPGGEVIRPATLSTAEWYFADWLRDRAMDADRRPEEHASEGEVHP